jgi:hypothetical protein
MFCLNYGGVGGVTRKKFFFGKKNQKTFPGVAALNREV